MYFCGLFNLDDWDDDAEYIVLDDFDIKYFPHWKCFLGSQGRFALTDKYRKKRTVEWGRPCIWLCNPEYDPRIYLRESLDWLSKNCVFIHLAEKLY